MGKSGESVPSGEPIPSPQKPLRILVAEDNPVNRELMVLLLERQGHRVMAVEDGGDVLRELEKCESDIVIMDQEMPRMSGLDAARAIRAKEKSTGRHIPIITVTGNATEADRRRGREAGVDAHLAKPIHVKELFQAITELCGGDGDEGADEEEGTPSAATCEPAGAEEAALLERVGGNAKVLRDLARIFLTDTPKRMKVIRGAIQKRNAGTVASTAHSLKGSAGIFGAKEIVEEARNLEMLGRSGKLEGAGEIFEVLELKIVAFEVVLKNITAEGAKRKRRAGARRSRRKLREI
jgi:CheY-like chemotaxis protein